MDNFPEVEIQGISRLKDEPHKVMVSFKPIIIEFDAPPSDEQMRELMEAAFGATDPEGPTEVLN